MNAYIDEGKSRLDIYVVLRIDRLIMRYSAGVDLDYWLFLLAANTRGSALRFYVGILSCLGGRSMGT
jgi:hypothetical protein